MKNWLWHLVGMVIWEVTQQVLAKTPFVQISAKKRGADILERIFDSNAKDCVSDIELEESESVVTKKKLSDRCWESEWMYVCWKMSKKNVNIFIKKNMDKKWKCCGKNTFGGKWVGRMTNDQFLRPMLLKLLHRTDLRTEWKVFAKIYLKVKKETCKKALLVKCVGKFPSSF